MKRSPADFDCEAGQGRASSTPPSAPRSARLRHASYSKAGPRHAQAEAGPRLPHPTSPGRMPSGLSRHEARPPRCSSAIGLMQKGITDMTHLGNGTVATDIDATTTTPPLPPRATPSATSRPGTTTTAPSSSGTLRKSPKRTCPSERDAGPAHTGRPLRRVHHPCLLLEQPAPCAPSGPPRPRAAERRFDAASPG